MKTDGYILTPELLQWRYFHRPVVVQVLIYVLLSATHNEASAATLSLRMLADRLHTSVKSIRCAIDVLIQERIITKCSSPKASTIVYVNSSHPLSHCILPYQNPLGAQNGALFRAQRGAQSGAQILTSQVTDTQDCAAYLQDNKGTDRGTIKGKDGARSRAHPKQGAHQKAQSRAQINNPETPLNKGDSEDSAEVEGTDKGNGKGTEIRGKKQIKENISPEPPIKENKQRKEKAHTHTQKKEKEKKSLDPEVQFSEVLRLFNRLFLGTQVKPISKMTPDPQEDGGKVYLRLFLRGYRTDASQGSQLRSTLWAQGWWMLYLLQLALHSEELRGSDGRYLRQSYSCSLSREEASAFKFSTTFSSTASTRGNQRGNRSSPENERRAQEGTGERTDRSPTAEVSRLDRSRQEEPEWFNGTDGERCLQEWHSSQTGHRLESICGRRRTVTGRLG